MKNFRLLVLLMLAAQGLLAQDYQYSLTWDNPRTHYYQVELQTAASAGAATVFEIPAWRPGRYFIQDYAAAVTGFAALDVEGKPLAWQKISNHAWQVQNPKNGAVTVRYRYFANTLDAGASMLDASMAYFNPSNLFMHVRGEYARACTLRVPSMGADWQAATSLAKLPGSKNAFTAPDYHEFVDAPTVLSPTLKTLHSHIDGVDYYFHFQGPFANNKGVEDAYQNNVGKIIREEAAIFGGVPFKEYHFIYHLLPFNMGHAVEHSYSSCYAMGSALTESPEAIAGLNAITAHEFFHLWNVKRIRPAAMWPYNYQQEAYTRLQWFTEGVTDYYAELTLVRAGLIDRKEFYKSMAGTIEWLENSYAARMVSCEQASFDSWLERSAYAIPHHRISYYTLGTRVGLLLDLMIRAETKGKNSLDDVFRQLYKDYYQAGKGLEEDAVQRMVQAVAQHDFADFFRRHVAGVEPVDYQAILGPMGLALRSEPSKTVAWEKIGLERQKEAPEGITATRIRPGSDLERAGMAEAELITAIDGKTPTELDDKAFFDGLQKGQRIVLDVKGGGTTRKVEVVWTDTFAPRTYILDEAQTLPKKTKELLDAWLSSQVK